MKGAQNSLNAKQSSEFKSLVVSIIINFLETS
jgi:hypothetical protein